MSKMQRGFTFVELLVVVGLLSIAALVAIPEVVKFVKKSKTNEARHALTGIYEGARAYYRNHGQFPVGETNPTGFIARNCCANGSGENEKCASDPHLWSGEPWIALAFSIDEPHYYAYEYQRIDEKTFVARAQGDLDCDGERSQFSVTVIAGKHPEGLAEMPPLEVHDVLE